MLTDNFTGYEKFKTAYQDAYQQDLAAYLIRSLPIKPDVSDPVAELLPLTLPPSMVGEDYDEDYDEDPIPMMSTVILRTRAADDPILEGGPGAWLDLDDD
jgi:hypothetical protein